MRTAAFAACFLALACVFASEPALARHTHVGVAVGFGYPYWGPWGPWYYPPPYYYYPPAIVVQPQQPTTYIEQSTPAKQTAPSSKTLVVLLRCFGRLLSLREGVPERLGARAARADQMRKTALVLAASLAAACASPPPLPTAPSILVLPGTGKSFDQFHSDDQECRGFALSEVGKGAAQSSDDSYAATVRLQRHYDNAFAQCMFARGHKVPVSGTYSDRAQPERSAARTPPPPPSGEPPAEAPSDYRPK